MLKHYITVAFRNLWKYRIQNILGITGLSLGFLCFSVIVFDIEWQTGYDTEYPGAGRMYILRTEYRSDYNGNIYSLTQALPEIEKMTVCGKEDGQKSYTLSELSDTAKSQRYRLMLGECDTAFIDFFSLKILAGNRYSINRTVNGIVLFDTKAKQMNENIHSLIGTSFQSGDEIFQIAGIVKRPVNSRINFGDGFIINRLTGIFKDEIYNRWNDEYRTFIMLKNSVPEKKFKETLSNRQFSFTLYGDQGMRKNADGDWIKVTPNDEDERFTVKPLNDLLEYKSVTDYLSKFFIGLLVLLTTLFNYTSFQTSVFYNRLKECALRRTAGAGKKDLFFLFFTEIIIAFIITYFVSILLLDLFKGYITEHGFYLPDLNLVRISMLRYLLFVLLIASVLYAIPINVIHRMSIRSVFLGISQKGKKGTVRNVMLFLQLVILLLFISAFAVVGLQTNEYRTQLFRQLSKEDKSNIFYTFYSEELRKNDDVIISELRSSPLVADVIPNEDMADEGVMYFYDNDGIDIPNFYGKEIGHTRVHPGFFEFFQCELVEGKFFTENSSPRDVVVDENFASYYKDKSPVGESFNGYKIVGVIKNLNTYKKKHEDFHADKFPMFYSVMSAKVRSSLLYVKSQKGKTQEVRQLFDKTVKRFLPPQDRNATVIHPFDKALEWSVEEEKILLRSMRVLFIISLFICLLGIYSAIVTNTEKRRKEIAIRKINGATVKDIIVLFGKTYVVLWTAACILFFPAVYYLADKWLANYVVRISLDIGFFAGIYITVMTLVFLTIIFQILRVAKCNPAEVIKKE